jgi:hypothetical protein
MNVPIVSLTSALLLLTASTEIVAQQQDVIIKAMQDELTHNMSELRLPGFEKPFFMLYSVTDQKRGLVSATLGALVNSSELHQRFKSNTRILVGDYSFNDESLEDNLFSSPSARDIDLPLDDDYIGIRRAFWSTSDKVYRDAAKHFENHKKTVKESGKTLEEIPHRSFAKMPAVQIISSDTTSVFDCKKWEPIVKKLSAVFLKHPSVLNSSVTVQNLTGFKYIVTSEGTTVKIPVQLATYIAIAQARNSEGEFAIQQMRHMASTDDKLPNEDELSQEIEELAARIEEVQRLPKMDEVYNGPVLIIGSLAAETLAGAFFNGREGLVATDNIPKLKGLQFDNNVASLETKVGKNITHASITIKAKPKLKEYQGTDLLGSFAVDGEGVVPPDEVLLVENGVLKAMLNNRTLTGANQAANGFSSGLGVIETTFSQKDTDQSLKDKLIAKAKEEGLDYAIIIRDEFSFGMGIVNAFKIHVKDGKEELTRNNVISRLNLKSFKNILGASARTQAVNLGQNNGPVASFILPESILFDDMEIQPFKMPTLKEEDYVSNPLVK